MILTKTLTRLGIRVVPSNPSAITDVKVQITLEEILHIYDKCLHDPDLARAAYGLAIGGTALALNVTLKTAALLVEHALVLRGIKDDRTIGRSNVSNINQPNPGADERHSDDHRPSLTRQAGDSESSDV